MHCWIVILRCVSYKCSSTDWCRRRSKNLPTIRLTLDLHTTDGRASACRITTPQPYFQFVLGGLGLHFRLLEGTRTL